MVMNDVLVRGLSDAAIERIDAEAASLGLSRNEFLRRRLEGTAAEDWARSVETFGDLADQAVMDAAWQ